MIRLIGKIPRKVTVACSGGVDSMAVVNFLRAGKRKVDLAYFNHDTTHSKNAQKFLERFSSDTGLPLKIGKVRGTKGRRSLEEFWRDERYAFLDNLNSEFIITCHHLDDVVETWLMSSIHGNPKLIPYSRNENIFRPFLMTEKKHLISYATRYDVEWVEDPSNRATKNIMRNHVRHNLMPQVLKVNPGIRSTIRKKIIEKYKNI
tara:strand:- start:7542 stop:8153 length:612 start_codon:yes stop_codon:yes gene_type:complete